jgi:hypothetical protein
MTTATETKAVTRRKFRMQSLCTYGYRGWLVPNNDETRMVLVRRQVDYDGRYWAAYSMPMATFTAGYDETYAASEGDHSCTNVVSRFLRNGEPPWRPEGWFRTRSDALDAVTSRSAS